MSNRTRDYVANRLAQIKEENKTPEDIINSLAQGEPNKEGIQNAQTDNEIVFTLEAVVEPVYPIIQSYTFIRISDGQTGGFTHAIITTQGDKVLKTDIVDHIYPKNIAEDDFRATIARQIFHLASETTYQIEFKDGRYQWKPL